MPPEVSVVLPAYRSEETLGPCLRSILAQDHPSFEVIVVDSSPDERSAEVARGFPTVRLVRAERRMLPHEARNEGVAVSSGELLVFADPDVYARPDWLSRLVGAHRETSRVIVGSLACYGNVWLDVGIHLCKFSKWLPGGAPRRVDMSPTANMLLTRAAFERVGGFDPRLLLGDVVLSWRLVEAGETLWFEPEAEVAHHHLSTFRSFLRERFGRGILFGELRAEWRGLGRAQAIGYLAASLSPFRIARIGVLMAKQAAVAGQKSSFLLTAPVSFAGHCASLAGEAVAYWRRATGGSASPR